MKILSNTLKRYILPAVTAITLSVPIQTSKNDTGKQIDVKEILDKNFLNKKCLDNLKIVADTNFVGGITYRYDDESVKKLKQRIYKPDSLLEYEAPIENGANVYTEPFGYFFANRPNGVEKRPHMGLDIFTTPYSRKPEKPVTVQAPVDGVVIAHKKARKEDNLIGNMVTILGRDGRRYAFDHLARPDDYSDSIPMPVVGTIIKKGDPIGYVGSTGETTLWHLHMSVMTDEALRKQQSSDFWKTIESQSNYSRLKGQVNPLSPHDAGPIANKLCKYRGAKPDANGTFKLKKTN